MVLCGLVRRLLAFDAAAALALEVVLFVLLLVLLAFLFGVVLVLLEGVIVVVDVRFAFLGDPLGDRFSARAKSFLRV